MCQWAAYINMDEDENASSHEWEGDEEDYCYHNDDTHLCHGERYREMEV